MKNDINEILNECKVYIKGGKVANYIPELSKTDPNKLGISIYDAAGNYYDSGDSDTYFTIQSVSKPLVLLLALMDNDEEVIFSKVGMEPTGDPFNSIIRLETFDKQKPLNPFINAGAISIVSLIKGVDNHEKINRILDFVKQLSDNNAIYVDQDVFLSEKITGNRNRSMLYFLKAIGNITGNAEDILDLYFMQCAIKATCKDLARIGLIFSCDGYDPIRKKQIVPARATKIVKALMATCGMYDESGEFAVKVGIPAKSGVGGGILCAVHKKYGIGVYGPSLDHKGNSIAGVKMLEKLSKKYDMSIY